MANELNAAERKVYADYMREYRKRNPEKQKEYRKRYWAKKAAEKKASYEDVGEVQTD